ncbi:helix-turn-helix domain-containing protein [Arthrobacter sp. AL08]|uniref:helix-turn-helix domain-containing protein n=1 Tax=unclassified Arthrobacter TaxID=235627 RepID=UPI002499D534|nr:MULTISPECIES: helix-turn-helix domain-containing protein [unclassified Arthrobacter]MDI3241642.1 helix-turn-helix domain-containing protein [Arthrobacter sp. AL05]MDI3277652.1 helix-turn-helix domain-containing protein [Arthrobacter sp. AL08]
MQPITAVQWPDGRAVNLLTLDESAEILRKSPAQLRWMIHSGTAPQSARIGGRRMFRRSDIEEFISKAFDDQKSA